MPVKSSHSSVLKWPDAGQVLAAARQWAARARGARPDVQRIGVFGSYARGNAGVGSDLDLVVVVGTAAQPFITRGRDWPVESLPVPTEVLVYSEAEWRTLTRSGSRFGRMLLDEVRWLD